MVLTGYWMHSHPRTKLMNWVRSCTMGRHNGGVRDRGGRDGHGDHDVHGDRDIHDVHGGDHGASSCQYPLIQCEFSCVYDGSGDHVVCEACGGDGDGDDVLSLACGDDGGWLSPSCGDRDV